MTVRHARDAKRQAAQGTSLHITQAHFTLEESMNAFIMQFNALKDFDTFSREVNQLLLFPL